MKKREELLIQEISNKQNIQLDLANYQAGVYILQIHSKEGTLYKRIVKQ